MSTLSHLKGTFSSVVLLAGMAAFLVFVYWESVAVMFDLWQMSSHQHGLLVVFISAYFIWRLLPQAQGIQMRGDLGGVAAITVLVLIWIASRLVGVQALEHLTVLAMMPAAVYAVAGRKYVGKLLFPLLFLLCAVPIGDSMVPQMMAITADVSAFLLRLTGIPVLRDGLHMTLPGGSFVVAEVCSGVRYLMSGLMLSLLFAYLTYRDNRKRIVFFLIAAVVLVLANGLRAYLIMAIASATKMRYLGGADHVYFGWVLFGLVIMSMAWVGARFADEPIGDDSPSAAEQPVRGNLASLPLIMILVAAMLVATFNPLQSDSFSFVKLALGGAILFVAVVFAGRRKPIPEHGKHHSQRALAARHRQSVGMAAVVAFLLVCGPQSIALLRDTATSTASVPDLNGIDYCAPQTAWAHSWYPRVRDADIEAASTYSCDVADVSVFVAGYASALQGKELVSSSNRLIPKKWSRHVKASSFEYPAPNGEPRKVRELSIVAPEYQGLVWYWYVVDSSRATGQFKVKALQVWALLRGRPAGGYVVLVTTPAVDDLQVARQQLAALSIDLDATKMLVESETET